MTTPAGPTTIVIFGVSGDLAARKLLPALYQLLAAGKLPDPTTIVGVARRPVTPDSLVEVMRRHIKADPDQAVLEGLKNRLKVVQMDSKDPAEYPKLTRVLQEGEAGGQPATRILHLAIPPTVALPVIEALASVGFCQQAGITTRLLLEKPFGSDLDSSRQLQSRLSGVAKEDQIYRIDHFLARYAANDIWGRQSWDHPNIKQLEVLATETIGIEGRADFFEQTGALRDFIQSHLLELTALTTMERPQDHSAAAVQQARADALRAISPIPAGEIMERARRGQYEGYREEVSNPRSRTETFAALKLLIEQGSWRGVPAFLVAGKALDQLRDGVRVRFKDGSNPVVVSNTAGGGYDRILVDAITGDQTNFLSSAEVGASWQIIDPILHAWQQTDEGLASYPRGSEGPQLWPEVQL